MKRSPPAKKKGSRFRFVTEIIAELKKVVWPTRQETLRLTTIVLVIILAIGIILGSIDYGFLRLFNVFLEVK